MSNKVEYDKVKNFKLNKTDLAVVLKTNFGKMVILKAGDRGLSVDARWINKDTKGKLSVGIAEEKEYRTYTDEVMDKESITGAEAIAMLTEAGYEDYKFPPQTADEMVASLFSK